MTKFYKGLSTFGLMFLSNTLGSPLAFGNPNQTTVNLDQGSGSVEFHATGRPSALKIVGKGEKPKGNFLLKGRQVTGEARFQLATLDTGIEMRTRHMKEKYLEVQKYPEARLTITKMDLPKEISEISDGASVDEVPFSGTLSLHGVDKPVTGTAKIERKAKQLSLSAQFGLKIADYGIALPTFAGITMADDVQVVVQESAPMSN